MQRVDVAVVGGGQAGLATSHELTGLGIEHVVLERGRVGQTWRDRWESFCLVTPNWTVQLPGGAYEGDDPDGYMPRDEIVAHLERYRASFAAPVREGVEVLSIDADVSGGHTLRTTAGDYRARRVVLATGAYQRPHRPSTAEGLPAGLAQLDLSAYRDPDGLPPGAVLIVGSGQSGCQIAEELCDAGRRVVVACGRAPWGPRRIGGRDIVWWASETGFLDAPVSSLPDPSARLIANIVATGHGGGHDLHLRTLQAMGVTLTGHLAGTADGHAYFADDLAAIAAWSDERYRQLMSLVRQLVATRGLADPLIVDPPPFDAEAPREVSLADFGAVIFATGFRPDYRAWLPWADAFDDDGFPIQRDGASSVVDGLYFVGVHFLRKRKSSILLGVGEDAAIVARTIAEGLGGPPSPVQ